MKAVPIGYAGLPALVSSIGGNIVLAGLFLRALLDPIAHATFIAQTGLWLFLVELLSIFVSGGAGAGSRLKRAGDILNNAIGFFAVSVFALAFGWALFGNVYLPLIFLGSTFSKMIGRRAAPDRSVVTYSIPLLLGSVFIVFVVLGPELLVRLFPFPETFDQYAPVEWVAQRQRGEISGEFVERPQTMLAWGIIYYSLAAVIEAALSRKARRQSPSPK